MELLKRLVVEEEGQGLVEYFLDRPAGTFVLLG